MWTSAKHDPMIMRFVEEPRSQHPGRAFWTHTGIGLQP
jgi:hypothetical protein